MALRSAVAPTAYPVTLEDAKLHLHETDTAQDDLISDLIVAATEYLGGIGGVLGRALAVETFELVLDTFPDGPIQIPLPPLKSVESIKYVDTLGVTQTLATGQYRVDALSEPGWVAPETAWPDTFDTLNAVTIRFVAGYDEAPRGIRAMVKLVLADLFANREGTGDAEVQPGAMLSRMIRRYRLWSL